MLVLCVQYSDVRCWILFSHVWMRKLLNFMHYFVWQSTSDNRTPDNRKMLISGQIWVRIWNKRIKWRPSLFLEWLVTGPVVSHSRNKDGRHFDSISGLVQILVLTSSLDCFIKRVINKILFLIKRSWLVVQISNVWLQYYSSVIKLVVRLSKSGYRPKWLFDNRTCPEIGLWL
jgi:hypothetical protein